MNYLPQTAVDYKPFLYLPLPSHPGYVISLTGRVLHLKTGKLLKNSLNVVGSRCYLQCGIGHIHRLLLSAIERRPLARHELARHKNGDTHDNRPSNLELGSHKQNALDRIANNTYGTKLKNQDVRDIRALAHGMTHQELAKRYKVSRGHIASIIARRAWKDLP